MSTFSSNCVSGQVRELLDLFKLQKRPIIARYQASYDAFYREGDNAGMETWKKNEGKGWRSKRKSGVTRRKVLAAYSQVASDTIPVEFDAGHGGGTTREDDPAIANMAEFVKWQQADSGAGEELNRGKFSAALYGEGWMRDVVRPAVDVSSFLLPGGAGVELAENIDIPTWINVSVWDVFRDIEVSSPRRGRGIIQVCRMTATELMDLERAGGEDCVPGAFRKIAKTIGISTGSKPPIDDHSKPVLRSTITTNDGRAEVLFFWGRVTKAAFEKWEIDNNRNLQANASDGDPVSGMPELDMGEDELDEIEVHAVVSGDVVACCSRAEQSERPWHWIPWEKHVDDVGIAFGVADAVRENHAQQQGAVRAFEDNKKLSSNLIMAGFKERMADGALDDWEPGKFIDLATDCKGGVRDALMAVEIPDVGQSIIAMLNLSERWEDEDSMVPRITSGMTLTGEGAAKTTAYEMATRVDKSGKYLGTVHKNSDAAVAEFVKWVVSINKQADDTPIECKGDGRYRITPIGFKGWDERMRKINAIVQALSVFGGNPEASKKSDIVGMLRDFYRLNGVDGSAYIKTDEQLAQDSEAEANSPEYQLTIQERQAAIEERRANAQERMARAQALIAGITQGDDDLKLKRAGLVHTIEKGGTPPALAPVNHPSTAEMPREAAPARPPADGLPPDNADAGAAAVIAPPPPSGGAAGA